MSQPRAQSVVETIANTVLGYLINLVTQVLAFPYFGIHLSANRQVSLGLIFTAISLIRSYALRRLFNRFHT